MRELLNKIPEYKEFLTVAELDSKASELGKHPAFEVTCIGHSERGHPINLIKVGNGKQKVFLWAFPHPNEPIGSMTLNYLLDEFKNNQNILEKTDCTFYCIFTIDPDGAKMNEGWFKGPLTLSKYFKNFCRQPAHRMIDWTFPIEYKDFRWNKPLKETQVLINIIDSINPDIMYPLHNAGFGGAYFLSTKQFPDEYYERVKKIVKQSDIPLHMGEPEEQFMEEIEKPFYWYFGLKEYYENAKNLGKNPSEVLNHGDNSANYLLRKNPDSVTIVGEVPYFFSSEIENTTESEKTRRENWLDFIEITSSRAEYLQPIVKEILEKQDKSSQWIFLMKEIQNAWEKRSDALKKYVLTSPEFDRKATKAELFDGIIGSYFYKGGLTLGQVRRAAIEANINNEKIEFLERKIDECVQKIEQATKWENIPIRNMIKVQLGLLIETLEEMKTSTPKPQKI